MDEATVEAPAPKKRQRRRSGNTKFFLLRLSPGLLSMAEEAAERAGLNTSEWTRRAMLQALAAGGGVAESPASAQRDYAHDYD